MLCTTDKCSFEFDEQRREYLTLNLNLKILISEIVKRLVRAFRKKGLRYSAYLRESTSYADIGEGGELINIFDSIKDIPGWFNVDDCGHFFLLLSYQSAIGIEGNLFEIGSYHGRSTAFMAKCLKLGENIVVCDAFDSNTDDHYINKPSPENLLSNIRRVNRGLEKDRIVIHKCLSNDLRLSEAEKFRFIHIDGGHSAEQAYFDLELCGKHLLQNGIIVMDDYHNKQWPGVTVGTDRFLADNGEFHVLADLNRHGALGRKLYIMKHK